jgi:hypothetical protein
MSYPSPRTRIANESDLPTPFVRAAYNFCVPVGVKKIDVVFFEPVSTDLGGSCGRCCFFGVPRNNFQRPFIYVAAEKADHFPSPWRDDLPNTYFASREEAAIYILAHELRHVWQRQFHGQFSERDADAYALHCLRQWRRSWVDVRSFVRSRGHPNGNQREWPTNPLNRFLDYKLKPRKRPTLKRPTLKRPTLKTRIRRSRPSKPRRPIRKNANGNHLEATATRDLELFSYAYRLPGNFSALSDFERSAILKGIDAELADRNAARESDFQFQTKIAQLEAMVEERDAHIGYLGSRISQLERELELEQATASPASSAGARTRQ